MILLLSFSLNPNSRSYKAIKSAHDYLISNHIDSYLIDIRDYHLPFYNGTDEVLSNNYIQELFEFFNKASKIIIASPVYNYDVNASLKNFIDFLSVMRYRNAINTRQIIGFIGAMGSEKSFASLLPSLTNIQFALGVYLIPKIVMCTPKDFDEKDEITVNLDNRIIDLCDTLIEYAIS